MRVDTHVTRRSTETFPFTVGYMLLCLRIPVLLCHAKIYDVNQIGIFRARAADEEVVWFDVAVD